MTARAALRIAVAPIQARNDPGGNGGKGGGAFIFSGSATRFAKRNHFAMGTKKNKTSQIDASAERKRLQQRETPIHAKGTAMRSMVKKYVCALRSERTTSGDFDQMYSIGFQNWW